MKKEPPAAAETLRFGGSAKLLLFLICVRPDLFPAALFSG